MKQFAPFLSLALIVLMTTACTVGPDFVRPTVPAGAGYSQYGPTSSPQSIVYGGKIANDWYTLFHSNALNGLVHEALTNNPDLESARHSLLAAQYELTAVAGTALPQFDATAGISRTKFSLLPAGSSLASIPGFGASSGSLSTTFNEFTIGPSLTYQLDVFGGLRRSIESQGASTAANRDQVLNTYITLVNQVVTTAFNYATTQAQIDTTRALVQDLQAQVDLTRRLEAGGKVTRSDTLTAQSQLETTVATLPGLEKQRDIYRNALAQALGKTPDEFGMPALTIQDFTLPKELPLSLPSSLVQQRPDVLAAEENLHQASAAVGVAEAARLPSLSLTAQYSQEAGKLNQLFTQPAGVWSAGLNLTAPLFEGGTLSARAEEAKEQYRQMQATYRSTVITAFVDVANALQAVQHDAASYEAYSRALADAAASRDLAEHEYRSGKYNELQVLTAQQLYQNAVLSQVQADAQRFSDTAALFRALGGGWWNAPQDPSQLPVAKTASIKSATSIAANDFTAVQGDVHD